MNIEALSMRDWAVLPFLCTTRIAMCLIIAPFFSTKIVSGPMRNGVVLSLSLMVLPIVIPTVPAAELSLLHIAMLLMKEAILGLLIGYLAGAPFWIADSVGYLIDTQRGTSAASVYDPTIEEQTSPIGDLLLQLTIALFYVTSGFLFFLGVLFDSYRLVPVFGFFPTFDETFPTFMLGFLDHLMRLVVVLSAPVVLAMLLSDIGLGFLNRFAPSLPVFFLSMPIKSALAVFVLALYLLTLMLLFNDSFFHFEFLKKLFVEISKE
jgi:type III secretion protein T